MKPNIVEKMTSEAIETRIISWFKKTGFPLEMAVADAFHRAGFEIRQSNPYIDPETGKNREIDVLAIDPDWAGIIDIEFFLECKSSTYPWVVLCSENGLATYNRVSAFSVSTESAARATAKRLQELKSYSFFERSDDNGYGFRQALGERSDVAYGAAMNTFKACVAQKIVKEELPYNTLSFHIPVIVVDSPLFECRLTANGDLSLKQVRRSEFLFRTHMPKPMGCCIRVVTKEELPAWAAEAKALANSLREDFEEEQVTELSKLDGPSI